MLTRFTVANFASIRTPATLSLEASTDDWLEEDNVAEFPGAKGRFVKVAAIFGPNAGGKSNLLHAIDIFRGIILNSSKDTQKGEALPVTPFRLSTVTESAPSFFEAVFFYEGTYYRYGFEATRQAIVSEWLFMRKNSIRESCLFTRERGDISLRTLFKEGRGLPERTRENSLFISVVAQFNGPIAGQILSLVEECRRITGLSDEAYLDFTSSLLSDPDYAEPIKNLVRQADFGIENFTKQEIDKETFLASLPSDLPQSLRDFMKENATGRSLLKSVHRRFDSEDEPAGTVEFDLARDESAGTRQFLAFAGPFLHTLREGAILIVDELDARLHPLLTKQLVGLFNSSANNKGAQLIFATHDQGLLDQRRIRRDQVWFIEKTSRGESELFSLSEIAAVRKDANFQKEYLLGQFGGVPHIGNFQRAISHVE